MIRGRRFSNHLVSIDENQRQLTLLALAHLAVKRPGDETALREIAVKLQGAELYRDLQMVEYERAKFPKTN